MMLSILHRATGVALGAGTLLIAWWVLAIASGPDAYGLFQGFITSILGRLILFGFSFALILHALNGIRHLFWDMGKGFELETVRQSGLMVVILAISLTVITWAAGYWVAGSF
ncbi:MAG: succinate dehydrogenase, cytochrome b556 subunit [Pirellulales bacterium]|nr:succinate dehydrogenase, cytochrome b556 subunit [Pirellulales bacterium]